MNDASELSGAIDAASEPIGLPACYAPGDNGLLGLRLGGLFGILVLSTAGVSLPAFAYKAKSDSAFFVLRAFAAGVVLATGYVHVLADAYVVLTDPCLALSGEYPWAMTFATLASLLAFNVEWVLHKFFDKKMKLMHAPNGELRSTEAIADTNNEILPVISPDQQHLRLKALHNVVIAYTFEVGIIFHSIFIGITLGISSDADTVRALMIALFFHQGNEGLALGVLFVKAGYSRWKYFLLAAAFVIVTPLGVAIGMAVSSDYNGESKAALATEGIFDSISAGILIYNGLCDLIVPTFSQDEIPQDGFVRAAGFVGLYAGAAIMCLIGKWA